MGQQLNLYTAPFRIRRERLSAALGAWLLVGVAALCLAAAALLRWNLSNSAPVAAGSGGTELTTLQARNLTLKDQLAVRRRQVATEMTRVHQVEQAIARVEAALRNGGAADSPVVTYATYFHALAHQAHNALWITGFSVSADGGALEIRGRALDASALPDYLSRLNAEPVFKGRRFAQLQIGSVVPEGSPEGAQAITEFVLRSGEVKEASR